MRCFAKGGSLLLNRGTECDASFQGKIIADWQMDVVVFHKRVTDKAGREFPDLLKFNISKLEAS